MSTPNSLLSERIAIVADVAPLLRDTAVGTSEWAAVEDGYSYMATIQVGTTDTTIDAKLQEATDSSGTGAQDITGKAITQLGATDDAKQAIINLSAAEVTDGFTHIALLITGGNGTLGADTSGLILRGDSRREPASDNDLASVAEIIS